jgi:hypothetical protein
MKTYIWAVDAGHAWLAVKQQELINLNIAHKISSYSYMKGGTVYLEEDCDARHFIEAYEQKFGVKPKTKEGKYWDRQPCRSFARYVAPSPIVSTQDPILAQPGNILSDYVEKMNSWNAIFGTGPVEFPLTEETAQKIASKLDSELSPENLHCDGEISARQAQQNYNFLSSVVDELNIYCDANKIMRPTIWEA